MKTKLRSFRDLEVWQLASRFSKDIYMLSNKFPKSEKYRLTDDFLRAARSIPANISEGWGRFYQKEKISFYNIARGSAEECSNHLIEALNAGYIDTAVHVEYQKKLHVIVVKLTNLINAIRKGLPSGKQRSVVAAERDCNSASVPNVSAAQRDEVFP